MVGHATCLSVSCFLFLVSCWLLSVCWKLLPSRFLKDALFSGATGRWPPLAGWLIGWMSGWLVGWLSGHKSWASRLQLHAWLARWLRGNGDSAKRNWGRGEGIITSGSG